MKKSFCLGIALVFVFSLHVAAQCSQKSASSKTNDFVKYNPVKKSCASQKSSVSKASYASKSSSAKPLIPYIESSYQLGLCNATNAVAFTGGLEKWVSRHVSISGDVQVFKTDWWMMCDVYSEGTYRTVIPAVKLKVDPGKKYRGFFIQGGIGYAFARDRGIEIAYTEDPSTGVKNPGSPTPANWDFNSVAPNFSWGFAMKVFKFPVTVSNTNYFAKTNYEGYDGFTAISTGVGLKLGLVQVKNEKKNCSKSKTASKTKKECIIIRSCNK